MKIGEFELDSLGHSGFLLRVKGENIIIDPYRISDSVAKADYLFITHSHNDHCSIRDIQKISKKGTIIFCPVDCQSTMMKVKNVEVHIVEKEDVLDFRNFKIECVNAYTINKHHPQNEGWLGYLLKFGNNIIYFAGDTDFIPEMKKLTGYGKNGNNFVVVLPICGIVTMDSVIAANTASILNSTLAIPHGYGSGIYGTHDDAKKFVELCRQKGIRAEMLEKI